MTKYIILTGIILLIFLVRRALLPLAIGIVLAYLLCPLVDMLCAKLHLKRIASVLLSYVLTGLVTSALILGFATMITGKLSDPTLKSSMNVLLEYYYQYRGTIEEFLGFSLIKFDPIKVLASLGRGLLKLLIGIVASIYLLSDKDYFLGLCNKAMFLFLGQRIHGNLREILFKINGVIAAFIRGVFIDSIIVALLSSIVLSILKVDMAVFIGCFAGIANIIPYFGPFIGIVPAAISALVGGSIGKAILVALALTIVQQIECNFIYPKIISDSIGLHPLLVLTSVTIAGYFGGFLWMILAVPIAGIVRVLFLQWAERQ